MPTSNRNFTGAFPGLRLTYSGYRLPLWERVSFRLGKIYGAHGLNAEHNPAFSHAL